MKNSGAIDTLTSLIQLNYKRLLHYKKSIDKTKDMTVKLFFMRQAVQSQGYVNLLNRWVMAYGGVPTAGSGEPMLMETWSRIMDSLTSDSRNILLNRCEILEQEMVKIYRTVLALSILPAPAWRDVQKQADELEEGLSALKKLNERKSEGAVIIPFPRMSDKQQQAV
jgi:uncharacterized protein (TIGR02284 family)